MWLPITTGCYFHELPEEQKKGTLIPVLIIVTDFLCSNRDSEMDGGWHWHTVVTPGILPGTSCWMKFNHPPAEAQAPFPSRAGLGWFPGHRKPDPGVSAQNIYYTGLKPTNAAPAPGGSPGTPGSCCSLPEPGGLVHGLGQERNSHLPSQQRCDTE